MIYVTTVSMSGRSIYGSIRRSQWQDNQGKENIKEQRKRFNEKKKEKQNEETTE